MKKANLNSILKSFDYFFIDQWGVLHNGKKKYSGVDKFINILNKNKKKIILISNSSQTKKNIISDTLKPLKFDINKFDRVICSGEIINKHIRYNYKNQINSILSYKKCYVISNSGDEKNINFFKLQKTNIRNAKFILAMSLPKNINIEEINKTFYFIKKFKLPMICTNPDKFVFDGNNKNISYQVGYLANLYKQNGGKVIYIGKPYVNIFREAIKNFREFAKNRSLMIGDSMETDIKGAENFKIKSLLILNGIHKSEVKNNLNLKAYFKKKYNILPDFISKDINNLTKY